MRRLLPTSRSFKEIEDFRLELGPNPPYGFHKLFQLAFEMDGEHLSPCFRWNCLIQLKVDFKFVVQDQNNGLAVGELKSVHLENHGFGAVFDQSRFEKPRIPRITGTDPNLELRIQLRRNGFGFTPILGPIRRNLDRGLSGWKRFRVEHAPHGEHSVRMINIAFDRIPNQPTGKNIGAAAASHESQGSRIVQISDAQHAQAAVIDTGLQLP